MTSSPASSVPHLDVLIVGAGISGIGAARYLSTELPGTSYAVLEARGASGGTWDLFRYPGIRSDSDLHTFGYEFKPWTDPQSIADADKILTYLRDASREHGVEPRIRYHQKVVTADFDSVGARWRVEVEDPRTGELTALTSSWLFGGTGYYDYDEGFTPHFEGRDRFRGEVVHPQHWPDDLEYAGKRVVVIGSGATAVTLVPALAAGGAAHVTMLQRTPTYVIPMPSRDAIANLLPRLLGARRGYALARRKNILTQRVVYQLCRRFPRLARRVIRSLNVRLLPDGFDVDTHFNPPYEPWDQRMCLVPDGDLFRTLRQGDASVVTDRISTFTEDGIALESGEHLPADIIVTATGLNLQLFGGIDVRVDGEPVRACERVAYKGMMLSGVPNLAFAIGYTTSSWTLKVGLLCEHFTRLLAHMQREGLDTCVPEAPAGMETRPLIDFKAGYVQRALPTLPRQGDRFPWQMSMGYADDVRLVRGGEVVDPALRLSSAADRASRRPESVTA